MAANPANPLFEVHIPPDSTDASSDGPADLSEPSDLSDREGDPPVSVDRQPTIDYPLINLEVVEPTWMFSSIPWALEFPTILFGVNGSVMLVIPRIFCSNPQVADSHVKGVYLVHQVFLNSYSLIISLRRLRGFVGQ